MEEQLDKNVLIEKIQKILSLANGTNFGPEAETAKRKAGELMAAYAVSMSEVLNTKQSSEEAFIRIDIDGTSDKKVNWESALAFSIAKAFDSRTVNTGLNKWEHWKIAFIGMKSDLELSIHFFKFLRRTVGQMSDRTFSNKSDKMTYAYSLAVELGRRLEEIYKIRNEISPECRDLVVVKNSGVEKTMKDIFPHLTYSKPTLNGSHASWEKGRQDAQRVSLVRPITGGNSNYQRISQ
jgi:hypothetical protein